MNVEEARLTWLICVQPEVQVCNVPFRLPILLAHYIGDYPRQSEIVDGASDIDCQQHDCLRNRFSHVPIWLYSSKPDLHLCIRT